MKRIIFILIGVLVSLALISTASAYVLPSGMVAYWTLDEGTGTLASDSVGSNHGTVVNPNWTSDCRVGNCPQSVVRGQTYVTIPDSPSLDINTDQLTLEAWVYPFSRTYAEGQGNCGWVLAKINSAGTYGQYNFCVGGAWQAGNFEFMTFTTNGLQRVNIHTEGVFPANQWYHFAGVYDGSEMRFYINGNLEGSAAQHGAIVDTDAPVWLGKYCGGGSGIDHCYHDKIDEAAVYNQALSAEEIQKHYQQGLAGARRIGIDIKPGSDPNCFNNNGHGVIPVALLSDTLFDATLVDPTTVQLDGQGVRVVGRGNLQAHIADLNGDGLNDLMVQIEDVDGTYQTGDTLATLSGETDSGLRFYGEDSICIVP